jgi:hypothetical protein
MEMRFLINALRGIPSPVILVYKFHRVMMSQSFDVFFFSSLVSPHYFYENNKQTEIAKLFKSRILHKIVSVLVQWMDRHDVGTACIVDIFVIYTLKNIVWSEWVLMRSITSDWWLDHSFIDLGKNHHVLTFFEWNRLFFVGLKRCFTPDQLNGVCIELSQCEPLKELRYKSAPTHEDRVKFF